MPAFEIFTVETATDTIYYVSAGQDDIYKTDDGGASNSRIHNGSDTITGMYLDTTTNYLYFAEARETNPLLGDKIEVNYIDLGDDSINLIGVYDHGGADDLVWANVFIISGTVYINSISVDIFSGLITSHWGGAAWVDDDTVVLGSGLSGSPIVRLSDTLWYFLVYYTNNAKMFEFDSTGPTLTAKASVAGDEPALTQTGLAYDGSNFISCMINDAGTDKLCSFDITENTLTALATFDVALQVDNFNDAVVPHELEKAFGTGSKIVYEIKPKKGGIIQLQDMFAILANNIIAITDNYLIDSGGVVYKWVDVVNEITVTEYDDSIVGKLKKGFFTAHPDSHTNWNIGDSIKWYDDNDILEFWGIIIDKNQQAGGLYRFPIDSFSNEFYRTVYDKVYSGDDLDTKQKDIIDNACSFCYRSSSIVGTTQVFDYAYTRAIAYLFYLGRFLERQVPYIESDGKVWTKAHDGLAKNAQFYPGTYNFKDDALGSAPSGWTDNSGGSTSATIIRSLDGHRNVLQLADTDAGASADIEILVTQGLNTELEFYVTKNSVAANTVFTIAIYEGGSGGTILIHLRFTADDLDYFSGGFQVLKHNFLVADTLTHFKLILNDTANTFDCYIDGILEGADLGYRANSTSGADTFRILTDPPDTGYNVYFDALGLSIDPTYKIGDNEVAWDIAAKYQNVNLIDIPDVIELQTGFFDGTTGITRAVVRYKDNATITKPVAATRDPIEQLNGIKPLNEFRDPKIEGATEAGQIGTNLYDIFSPNLKFLSMRVEGQGFFQCGKTLDIRGTGQVTIAQNDFLLLEFKRDPKNDIYRKMIVSDSIVFTREFKTFNDTSPRQLHTAVVQSFENQADINRHLTREGGKCTVLINKTGVASVKGTIVEAHAATDNAFRVADASSVEGFGIVYDDGIADGSECRVVTDGRCQVLLKDATLSTRNNWVMTSDVAGRADATNASPAASPQHFKEIGHCIESKGADTDVLAFCMVHFL